MRRSLIELHFLPSVEYFCALHPVDDIQFEGHEHYIKQTYRNRCYLLAANGVSRHSIPLTGKHGQVPVREVRIDYSIRWQATLWRAIQSGYAHAPYFEHYRDDLHAAIFRSPRHLIDLNYQVLSLCLNWLGWRKTISWSPFYQSETDRDDLRNVISDKTDFRNRPFLRVIPYRQVFGNTFVPNLSILDVVCGVGPDAGLYISRCAGPDANK